MAICCGFVYSSFLQLTPDKILTDIAHRAVRLRWQSFLYRLYVQLQSSDDLQEGPEMSHAVRRAMLSSKLSPAADVGPTIIGAVPNILFVFYSGRIVGRIMYSYSAE